MGNSITSPTADCATSASVSPTHISGVHTSLVTSRTSKATSTDTVPVSTWAGTSAPYGSDNFNTISANNFTTPFAQPALEATTDAFSTPSAVATSTLIPPGATASADINTTSASSVSDLGSNKSTHLSAWTVIAISFASVLAVFLLLIFVVRRHRHRNRRYSY